MKQMNHYRLKIKTIRSDMLYIHQRVTDLKKRACNIQAYKAEEKAEQIRKHDYEQGLIGKSK